MESRRELTAPCGLDCFNCKVYAGNISKGTISRLARKFGMEEDTVPCMGCRAQKGRRLNFSKCATFRCAAEKGVEFCFECDQFPCLRMHPLADGLRWYPHNLKLYNLCRIQKIGIDEWVAEESLENRLRYLHGHLDAGMGDMQIETRSL